MSADSYHGTVTSLVEHCKIVGGSRRHAAAVTQVIVELETQFTILGE
jgi:hypothetical protein